MSVITVPQTNGGGYLTTTTDPATGGILNVVVLTQAQYDALPVKDPSTEYNIVGS